VYHYHIIIPKSRENDPLQEKEEEEQEEPRIEALEQYRQSLPAPANRYFSNRPRYHSVD